MKKRKLRKPGPATIYSQDEVVTALWAFAKEIGCQLDYDVLSGRQVMSRANREAVGTALSRIMEAFGFEVASIQ